MKKFLSLVLALVMTMSLVTVSAGAKDFTDDSEITYKEAVDVISALGVVDGYSDGDFRPDDVLTRGAAAKIICNLILGPTTASALAASTAPFKDVPVTNTFAGYITYCSQQGIISGYADGTFRPTGTLSGNAFMKMLLGALGYDSSIEGYTGANWQVSVIKQASGIGLDDGNDEFVGSQAVTRQEAALYAFNMLQATMVEYDKKDTIVVGGVEITSTSTRKEVENPIEKQAIFENHHEPIIDRETWERVQELRKQRKRPNRYDEVGLFSGMLFCADCGHVMYQQRYQNKTRKQDCYICGSYKKRTRDCTAHFIRTDLLTAGVLSNLRQVTEYAAKHESRFVKLLIQQNEIGGKRKTAAATKQLEQAQERISEVSRIIKRLYEDNVNGKISDERFMELSADYEQEQRELKDRAAALQEELDKSQAATVNAEKFMGIVRKHLAFEELTPTLLREMIEKIVVHECSYDENGTRRQDIEIYYSFVGKIDLPE